MKDYTCVVKVGTEAYKRGDTYFYGKTLRILKKLTTLDLVAEECMNIGIQEGLENILNLRNCDDGVYNLIVTNISKDYESGYVDDWDLKLFPYTGETK